MFVMSEFFNIMAWLIRQILDNTDQTFFDRYSVLAQRRVDEMNEELEGRFPELFQQKRLVPILDFQKYDHSFFQRIKDFGMSQKDEAGLHVLVTLLSRLDNLLSQRICNYTEKEEKRGINSNVEITNIQLLPRVGCSWEHDSRGADYSNNLSNYLYFFYYIDLKQLKGYEVWSRFLDSDTFWRAEKRKYLKIGFSPLSNQGKVEWYPETKDGSQYFSIKEVCNTKIIEENVLKVLEKARKEEVDILIMPEMLGNSRIRELAADKLSGFPEGGEAYPALTILPSIWENHHNTVIVLDEYGEEVIQQEKQHPFPFKISETEKYLENIQPDRKIHLIHCEGIGRIAILICKDALVKEYVQMVLTELKVTLLIVPSFSTGNYNFGEMLQCCRTADCCVVWINTCSVAISMEVDEKKLEPIGFVIKTGKRSNMKNEEFLCMRKSRGCGDGRIVDCSQCVFTYNFPFERGDKKQILF